MRPLLALPLLLAACATPQERCQSEAVRDLRVMNELIAETQATLQRGYALREETLPRFGTTFCYRRDDDFGIDLCLGNEIRTRLRPVAVNLDDERAKLQTLQQKRQELETRARAQIESCVRLPG